MAPAYAWARPVREHRRHSTPNNRITVVSNIPSGTVHLIVDVSGYWQ